MSPSIILKDGEPCLSLGSAEGPRIISSVLQVIFNVICHAMPIEQAVRSERVHYEDKTLYLESANEKTKMELRSMGYIIDDVKPDYFFGGINATQFHEIIFYGGTDTRRDSPVMSY
jgi:gamma-glutamyltranspeptidase/glutathione hydrolase